MTADPTRDLDRVLDEALASMVAGEPRGVSGASVRQAMGESRNFRVPVWLAAAAVLIALLGVSVRKDRAFITPDRAAVARSTPAPVTAELRPAPSVVATENSRGLSANLASAKRVYVPTTTEPVYEGLPRLRVDSIDLPEPLRTDRLAADPIRVPGLEIAPLTVSTLSSEPNQEPPR